MHTIYIFREKEADRDTARGTQRHKLGGHIQYSKVWEQRQGKREPGEGRGESRRVCGFCFAMCFETFEKQGPCLSAMGTEGKGEQRLRATERHTECQKLPTNQVSFQFPPSTSGDQLQMTHIMTLASCSLGDPIRLQYPNYCFFA